MYYAAWNSWGCGRSFERDNGWCVGAFGTKNARDLWVDESNPHIDPRAITRKEAEFVLEYHNFRFVQDFGEPVKYKAYNVFPA